jgi:hypothetical protein
MTPDRGDRLFEVPRSRTGEVDDMRTHSDGSFDDEELVREGGVFVSRNGGREVGPTDEERALGDYVEDPAADDGVPGTRDDLPYDYGVEIAPAADQMVNGAGVKPASRTDEGADS